MAGVGTIRIGTSGYMYRHWRKGVFYPAGLPVREELAYYASHFSTVEINNSFYRLPTPAMFDRWREATPGDFEFAVKASRYITHVKRLRNVADEIDAVHGAALAIWAPNWARSCSSFRPPSSSTSPVSQPFSPCSRPASAGWSSSAIPAGIRPRSTSCWQHTR